jgi:hypothetical protein
VSNDDKPRRIPLNCKTLYELAIALSPVLRFHPEERFFPVLAESWLTHTTESPWMTDPGHWLGDLAPDPNRRGLALCQWQEGDLAVIAGQPVAGDRPMQLSTDDSDPYAIGRGALKTVDRNTFLDMAGWDPNSFWGAGDTDRLYALFSELSAAINEQLDWTPLHGVGDLPHAWIPTSVNPTVYCEATWAGAFPEISDEAGQNDFPPGDQALAPYLALTYHYLYPALETAPDGDAVRRLEGQWESATLFLRGEGLTEGKQPIVSVPPEFVVVSQNLVEANNYHHLTALAGWSRTGNWPQVELLGEHPVLYVSRGEHKFFFSTVGAGFPPPPPTNTGQDPGSHDDDRHEGGITDFAILALILLAIAALILIIFGAVVIAVVAAILLILAALWALFEWLASLFASHSNDSSGTPVPGSTPNPEANGDGTQGGGTEPPSGSAPPTGSTGGAGGGATFGLPNTGSPTGQATVSFDIRLVDRVLHPRPHVSGYPSDSECENPTWWDYSGGWGVMIQGGFGTGWEDGTRRVDEFGRSLAYWNGLRLSTVLHGGPDQG